MQIAKCTDKDFHHNLARKSRELKSVFALSSLPGWSMIYALQCFPAHEMKKVRLKNRAYPFKGAEQIGFPQKKSVNVLCTTLGKFKNCTFDIVKIPHFKRQHRIFKKKRLISRFLKKESQTLMTMICVYG